MPNTSSSPFFNTNKLTADATSSLVTDSVNTEIASSNLQRLDLDKDLVNQLSVSLSKTKALSEYQPEAWMLEKEKGILKQLNLAIVSIYTFGFGCSCLCYNATSLPLNRLGMWILENQPCQEDCCISLDVCLIKRCISTRNKLKMRCDAFY